MDPHYIKVERHGGYKADESIESNKRVTVELIYHRAETLIVP